MTMARDTVPDAIDAMLGADAARVAALRDRTPAHRRQLQEYYLAIFAPDPESAAAFPLADRALVAVRVASHTGSAAVRDWYADVARAAGADEASIARAANPADAWTGDSLRDAALRRADLVTLRPADTTAADLAALAAAGLSPAGILALSQAIAFVSYQLRLVAGLRALGAPAWT